MPEGRHTSSFLQNSMNIETPQMIIRNFTPEDAADLFEMLGEDETMENLEPEYGMEKTKGFLSFFCIGRHGAAAAVLKESGKLIGYILFHKVFAETIDTGIRRSQTKDLHGNWSDLYFYGLLEGDWRKQGTSHL